MEEKVMFKKILFGLVIVIIGAGVVIYTNPQLKERAMVLLQTQKATKVPTKEALIALVKENMQYFAVSLKEKSMKRFYNHISPFWQNKTEVKKLNRVFAPFIKSGIDLTPLQKISPIIDKTFILDKTGDLAVAGHYNTTPSVLYFKHTYRADEKGQWKLVEFFVELKKEK